MIGFISFVVVFSLLIFVHELGHFVTAKIFGVRVDEFGFGYPPRLLRLGKWRETDITINALPLGGFVRMYEDDATVAGSLASKGRRVRALVFVAGALMIVLLAVLVYTGSYMLGALTPVDAPGAGIYYVAPNSPADSAEIRPGDTIISIDGQTIQDVEQAMALIRKKTGQSLELTLRRDDTLLNPVYVTPRVDPPPNEGALGVALDLPLVRKSYPLWQAVPLGLRTTVNAVRGIAMGIRSAIRGDMPFRIDGPIGIYRMTTEVAKTGLERLIEFTAFLSLNLFLVNLLPLPALDGGRLIFILVEWVRRGRRVPPEKEGLVHAFGMMVLIAVMAVVTYFDYVHYFG